MCTFSLLIYPAWLGAYLGFSGVLGALIYQVRSRSNSGKRVLLALYFALVFMPASLALPGPLAARLLQTLLAIAVALAVAIRAPRLPAWVWSAGFAYRYFSGVMALVAAWGLSGGSAEPKVLLGLAAALAGWTAWRQGTERQPYGAGRGAL